MLGKQKFILLGKEIPLPENQVTK